MRFHILALTLLLSFSAPSVYAEDERTAGSKPEAVKSDYSETYRQLDLFGDVFERVREQYVDEKTDEELIENAIQGMLSGLDPHSSYLDEDDFSDMRVQTRGEFGGLGIEVTMENGVVKVVSPIDDTPAARAGMQAGDLVVEIDNIPVMGLSLSDAVDKMRGKVGTKIKLLVVREGEDKPIDVEIVRDVIKIQSVRHRIEGNVGYIRITQFNQHVEDGLEEAITEIKKELGNKLVGFVLDLRNNPGGLLDQSIAAADMFLDKGEIVSTRGRHESDTRRDNASSGDLAEGLPIVVLINSGSASASEIVAGALQDHKRAILLGTKSFGKGSVQTVMPLPGHGAMKLTTARYYTPSGRSIQALGIDPDIFVEQAKIESYKFRRLREEDLERALDKKEKDQTSEDEEEASEEPQDYQLLRAVDLLNGLSLYKDSLTAMKESIDAQQAQKDQDAEKKEKQE